MNQPPDREKTSIWSRAWRRPHSRWRLGIPLGGLLLFILGILFWGGFNWALEASNTETFCISCHEMRAFIYPEYQETIHYSNRTGVRASCPDCHVPHDYGPKLARKIQATNELYHKIAGTIGTREKFEAERRHMAERVWKSMKATDSRECRNCHEFEHMDFEQQERVSARRHERGFKAGETCIDCHKGVAHHLPEGYEEEQEAMGAVEGAQPAPGESPPAA
jgi:cytochrome c-type protein NapC